MKELDERVAELSPNKRALLALRLNQLLSASKAKRPARGPKRLVAYFVPNSGASPDPKELREFLTRKLPDYMVPATYVMLESLPLTPTGKIDRRGLPEPSEYAGELEEFVAPRDPVEEVVASIWADVLDAERVGAQSDFFELGGHSLAAAQVIYRVRDIFRVELPVRSLFESPTLEGMARLLVSREEKPGRTVKVALAYKKIKSMSDEEKRKALEEKKGLAPPKS